MKVGIITFADGRKRVTEKDSSRIFGFQKNVADWLSKEGHDPIPAPEIVWNWETAYNMADMMTEQDADIVIFNFCVWSYPDFTAQAAVRLSVPILFLGNINPSAPGWVAFFASAGALDEIGVVYGRALGDLSEEETVSAVRRFLSENTPDKREKGANAAEMLRGLRYGEFDGPSMGMYTGHLDQSQWMEQFGVHVFHRSQLTVAWLAEQVAEDRVVAGLEWLEKHCKEIKWNPDRLAKGPKGHLAKQIRVYLALKDYCKLEGLDFIGLTGQLDYTEWKDGCTMDVPEALLNDTADWEESNKKPIICATECDSNGALTMQMLHNLSGTPALFADLRHYFKEYDIYDLCNSGQHAPWWSKRSSDFKQNWKEVTLYPSDPFYFPYGGASVQFYHDAAEVTFARLTRKSGQYRMHYFRGSFEKFDDAKNDAIAKQTTFEWPHAFAKFNCRPEDLAKYFSANHIHAVPGDWMGEIGAMCEELGIEAIPLE